jgi:hypothetical protein
MIQTLNTIDNKIYLFVIAVMVFLFDVFTHQQMTDLTKMALLGFITYVGGQSDGRNQNNSVAILGATSGGVITK